MGEQQPPLDFRFGYLAVQRGFVSMGQIKECVQVKSDLEASGIELKLGEILIKKGYMSPEQVEEILRSQTKRAPQQMIGGFQLEKKLGEGAMGAVYKATQVALERPVALKILPKRLARNQEFVARFQREARMVARMDHANIVRGIDVGEENGIHYLAMEFIEGLSVGQKLSRVGTMDWREAIQYAQQVARGLDHAHSKGVVHRDIKPDNILIENKTNLAKLTDMGLARLADSASQEDLSLTQKGDAVGTPNYISPEQARGEEKLDARTDIYSLGATLYHMVTGSAPFKGNSAAAVMTMHITKPLDPPISRNAALPGPVSAVIEKMMAKLPEERYQSAAEVAAECDKLLADKLPVCMGGTASAVGGRSSAVAKAQRAPVRRSSSARRRADAPEEYAVRSSQLRRRHKRSVLGSLVLLTVLFLTLAVAGGAVYWFVVQKWTVQDLQRLITLGKLPNAGPQEPGPGPERPAPLPPSPPSP